jgi:hypothetical protein
VSFKEVIIHVNQGLFTAAPGQVQSHPPVVDYRLSDDLEITRLDNDLANKIMELCEPNCYGIYRPVRQFAQLYSFVRTGPPSETVFNLKSDGRLEMCIALSRLIHPTSVGFAFHVQLNLGSKGELTESIPIFSDGHATGAWTAEAGRDWLTQEDAAKLKDLVARLPLAIPPRVSHALWYHEFTAKNYYGNVRWVLVATALEALVHTRKESSTYQFKTRTAKIAAAVGLPEFSQSEAGSFYDLRSQLAHGQEVGSLSPSNLALYQLAENLLRKILVKAIVEPSFAATFAADTAVEKNWAK